MKLLKREQILTANDVVFEDVPCPEWAPKLQEDGVTPTTEAERADFGVRIRNMTGNARAIFIQRSLEIAAPAVAAPVAGQAATPAKAAIDYEIELLMVAMSAVDADNVPMFNEKELRILGAKNAVPLTRLAAVAQRLSGIDEIARAQSGNV